jgi:triosephosphate isomerase
MADKGAHTGCISAAMLLDAGARLTIVGHSERAKRRVKATRDVKAKAEAALAAGLGSSSASGKATPCGKPGRR